MSPRIGGGGNFGVVTEFTFRGQPVSDIVGGPTFWPIEQTEEVLTAYREFLPTLDRNATGPARGLRAKPTVDRRAARAVAALLVDPC